MTRPVAVAADVDDVAVMDEAVDEGGGHAFVAEQIALLFEALPRQVADLIGDQERRISR